MYQTMMQLGDRAASEVEAQAKAKAEAIAEAQAKRSRKWVPLFEVCRLPEPKPRQPDLSLDWDMYIKIAEAVSKRTRLEDREDARHDIIVGLALRKPKREGFAYLCANQILIDRWRKQAYRQHDSLDMEVETETGEIIPLIELFASNQRKLDDIVTDRELLRNMPIRAIKYAAKLMIGLPLTHTQYQYMRRFRLGFGQQHLF